MEALATLDQVAFNRSALVYEISQKPRISANSSAKFRRMTIDASCHNWFSLWRGGWLIPNGNHSLPGFGPSLPSLWRQETYCLRRLWKSACRLGRSGGDCRRIGGQAAPLGGSPPVNGRRILTFRFVREGPFHPGTLNSAAVPRGFVQPIDLSCFSDRHFRHGGYDNAQLPRCMPRPIKLTMPQLRVWS